MNIEEVDRIKSVEAASDGMILLHVADSNRRAPGDEGMYRFHGCSARFGDSDTEDRGSWSVRRRRGIRSLSTRRTSTAHWRK